MKLIEDAVRYPVTTTVGVLLLALFGGLALARLPVQLTPDITEPQVTVTTIWPGASPQEIEREVVDRQEEQLKSLEGLVRMYSSSADSSGTITLTFLVGTDLDAAVLRVSNRLEQVRGYPLTVERPIIRTSGLLSNAAAWFVLEPVPGGPYDGDLSTEFEFAEAFIKTAFERVPGVSASNIFGGREREMRVIVDPARLAARQLSFSDLGAAIDRENRNYSGGDFSEGKRRYIVRTVGEYQSPEDIERVVIAVRDGAPIYVRDVARAELTYRKPTARVFQLGEQVLAINVVRQPGSNVLDLMEQVKETAARLEAGLLASRGLRVTQVYDETDYVRGAIDLVRSSLLVGAFLAVTVLVLFLRSAGTTLVIAVAIPISLVGAFLIMLGLGRTLNVVSLAGLAFAVGMAVDNSIVVLENIYRHRQLGKSRPRAAVDGAREVWGAVLASTLTTVAVFVPIIFIREEAGQLFGDIAIAISATVALSLLVAITVIPSMSARLIESAGTDHTRRGLHNLWGAVRYAEAFTAAIRGTVSWILDTTVRRVAVAAALAAAAIGFSALLMPKTEYLPVGNNNFLFGILMPPPGYNIEEMTRVHGVYQEHLEPLWRHPPGSPEAAAQPAGGIRNFFFVALTNFGFMGARANDGARVAELQPAFAAPGRAIPGVIGVMAQAGIFQTGGGGGRVIDVELTGPDLERLLALGTDVFGEVTRRIPGAQARPIPGLDLGNPEVRVVTDRRRAAELGISNRELGLTVSALVDGARVSDYQHQGKELDLKVVAEASDAHRTHLLEEMTIATPDGRLVTLGAVAEVSQTTGPVQIDHSNRQRAITIQVTPPERLPLESAMDVIRNDIVAPMRDTGRLEALEQVTLRGSADKLTQTFRVLRFNFLLAVIITYLLMAALFESFLYPFVILFSVPLAALGGFLGLATLNALGIYQALDVLTMLGFIILVGTVVNNAILIVHQSLNHIREERLEPPAAIRAAVATRIRPIFMTVTTTVCAMLPLVLFPGPGSELYRGLGSVVIGGLVVSTFFTLFLVPALLSLALEGRAAVVRRLRPAAEQA